MTAEPIYYDGLTARRRAVRIVLDADGLFIHAEEDGADSLTHWPYDDLRREDALPGILRLSAVSAPDLARLDLPFGAQADTLLARAPQLKAGPHAKRIGRVRIVAWSLAAAASLIASAVFLVPRIADTLAPFVPYAVERHLGDAVDGQLRRLWGETACAAPAGQAALDKLVGRLNAAAPSPHNVRVAVLPASTVNAVTLPGGRIYVLNGLLPTIADADELAAILAHEMGHAAHRDSLRQLLEAGGTSFLLGLLFGDVTGSGSLILVGRTLIDSRYSRDAESNADAFSADVMTTLGRPPQALAAWLSRLADRTNEADSAFELLRNHPQARRRAAALPRLEAPQGEPLISADELRALKAICAP